MPELDHETFEREKYREYFPQLETAYRRAFEEVNDAYDSQLVHALDQQVLNESEPHYEAGEFEVDLPENPVDRVEGVVADDDRIADLLDVYVAELERQLAAVFDVAGD